MFSLCTDSGFDDGGHWVLFRSGSDRIYALVITILAFSDDKERRSDKEQLGWNADMVPD